MVDFLFPITELYSLALTVEKLSADMGGSRAFIPLEAAMLARSWDRNSVFLSVYLSVRLSHECFVTNERTYNRYFDTTRKGVHSSFLIPTEFDGCCPVLPEICA